MSKRATLVPIKLAKQFLFSTGSISFNVMERMILLYVAYFYLPPAETGMPELISNETYLGIFTVLGLIIFIGSFTEAFLDPVIAQFSDNCRSKIGRRKIFMIYGAIPLVISAPLVFYPPVSEGVSSLNTWWLALIIGIFYLGFTAYANPFLALIPELGHTNSTRINLSTFVALFGLLGMVLVMVVFPLLTGIFMDAGYGTSQAYRYAALIFAGIAGLLAYLSILSFNEKKQCYPVAPLNMTLWESIKKTISVKHFRLYLCGEMFVYFCVNIITLGMLYYAVVIFKEGEQLGIETFQGEQFMMVISGAALTVAFLSFPLINHFAKKIGKKKVLLTGVFMLGFLKLILFFLSFNMSGVYFYIGIGLFALTGFPLAALSTMLFSIISDIAREDAMRTGKNREGMFYGVRAIPHKIALTTSGIVFGFLISSYGKDIGNPLGIQLSLLLVSVMAFISFFFFIRFPEKEVLASLNKHEAERYQKIA